MITMYRSMNMKYMRREERRGEEEERKRDDVRQIAVPVVPVVLGQLDWWSWIGTGLSTRSCATCGSGDWVARV